MTTIDQIQSADWQVSAFSPGAVVEGGDDINQSIFLVLGTRKGSDPFRPSFGSDIWEHIDKPINSAPGLISRAIREAIDNWITRASIQSITYTFQDSYGDENGLPSGMRFDIVWLPTFSGDLNSISILVTTQGNGDFQPGTIIRILATEAGEGITTESGQLIALV